MKLSNMNYKLPTIIITFGLFSLSANAQLAFTETGTKTIDLQSNVGYDDPDSSPGDNVFKFDTGSQRVLIERSSPGWAWGSNVDWGFSADAWSFSAGGQDAGMGSGNPSQFGDYNNDGDFGDNLGIINAFGLLERDDLGIGSAGDWAVRMGNATNGANRSYTATLRVVNDSGSTLSNWSTNLDTWHVSSDDAFSTMKVEWSTNNADFNLIDSYVGTNTGGVASSLTTLDGSFNASVSEGEYLYLRLSADRLASFTTGSTLIFDNWSVSAIPEPSSSALIMSALGSLFLLRRRKRS